MRLTAVMLGAVVAAAAPPAPPEVVELDCAVKTLAAQAAATLQPGRDPRAIFAALQLNTLCGQPVPPAPAPPVDADEEEDLPHYAVWVAPGESLPAALATLAARSPHERLIVLQNGCD